MSINNNTTTTSVYEKQFIVSKTYCYYCNSCNYSRNNVYMKHVFTYNEIHNMYNNTINNTINTTINNNRVTTNDIWNRMIELTMNRNNNYEENEINVGIHIYYTQNEHNSCEFNLDTEAQRLYLLHEFIKKYL